MRRRLRILLRGSPRWVRMLGDVLPDAGIATMGATKAMQNPGRFDWRNRLRWRRSHIVHQLMLDVRSKNTLQFFRIARARRVPVIVHWIGSDVLRLREHMDAHGRAPAELFDHIALHLADSPELAAELKQLGVDTEVVRLLPRSVSGQVSDLPDDPAVMTYLPVGAESFYRIDIIKKLAEAHPTIPFYVVANDGRDAGACPGNMRFLGEVKDMDALYRKVTVLIRICEHDSVSARVLEAVARGRHVIYSESFPHTRLARDVDSAATCLAELVGAEGPNKDGAKYIAAEFSWRNELDRLARSYRRVMVP